MIHKNTNAKNAKNKNGDRQRGARRAFHGYLAQTHAFDVVGNLSVAILAGIYAAATSSASARARVLRRILSLTGAHRWWYTSRARNAIVTATCNTAVCIGVSTSTVRIEIHHASVTVSRDFVVGAVPIRARVVSDRCRRCDVFRMLGSVLENPVANFNAFINAGYSPAAAAPLMLETPLEDLLPFDEDELLDGLQ